MTEDIYTKCSSATRPDECRLLSDGVKCIFADRACIKYDPFANYKQSFLSFIKNESPKSMSECRNTAIRDVETSFPSSSIFRSKFYPQVLSRAARPFFLHNAPDGLLSSI
ncbi:hypothetical protein DICVIV_10119 [Dictyocaulus viviparus]|uniref:Uncharacterized protein n=1 Tax=Dictyocaulus viviparus TaxID=29172 RepID=A0A0D8XJB8_DICVI|nr:hypothetical protein DICVIV_10119 [Dictyocaulus viviparus]